MNLSADRVRGSWVSPEPGQPRLVFEASGTVHGTDGCNGIASRYTATADGAQIAPFAQTQMGCLGITPWLGGVRVVRRVGERLQIWDGNGHEIGWLRREFPAADGVDPRATSEPGRER